MKVNELRQLSLADLNKKLVALRTKVRELRFSIANNQLSHVKDLQKNKKEIAKILTIINEKRTSSETHN
ncbi:50S ribosomal protein L29 [Patescibacteria group bacterium]|jgi:large subunit ribosomal protein L29|nr:50S ribosomal protein L29 [Patescibacteria group bacterium]